MQQGDREHCRTHVSGTRRLRFPMRTRQEHRDSTTTTLSTSASRREHEASAHPWQEGVSLNSHIKIRGGEVWSQPKNSA